jgi:superfamily II DNA or RNA helicase
MVIGDEAHNFKAKSLTSLMDKCTEASYRIGTTGTLDGTATHRMVLEGLFGTVYRVTTTKTLMDQGKVANLKIKALVLNYPDEERKLVSQKKTKMSYADEIDFLVSHEKRGRFIKNLAWSMNGNTLVLYRLVKKHGEPLFKMIQETAAKKDPARRIYFVSGQTDVDAREEIRAIVEKEKNAIIVASLGTFSTGINIKNIHNIIFSSPSKSQVKVLQSIGRGLRKSDDGRDTVLYDIVDDLQWRTSKNHTLNHGAERFTIYNKEMFQYKVIEIPIG